VRLANAIALFSIAVLMGACSRSSPTSPTPTDQGSLPPAVHVDYDAGITAEDKTIIENAVTVASNYFQSHFQRTIAGPVTVKVWNSNGPFAAKVPYTGDVLTIYVQNEEWRTAGRMRRTKLVAHEMFHILQREAGWPNPWGGWLHEGSAEFMGDAIVIGAGMATIDEVRQCELANYFWLDGPSAPPLDQLSFDDGNPTHGRYAIAWLAWDRLLGGPDGTPKLVAYWTSGFQAAFGQTEQSFSRDFEQYRRSLRPPGGDVCSSLYSR